MSDNGGSFQLDNYVEVNERITKFYEKYPDGSLQGTWTTTEVGGSPFVVYQARAHRTADDERPGVGTAWEPFPGKTPYTKDSELMNAETSAWGRALAALGFEVHRGIASANEVRSRQGGSGGRSEPSEKQLDFLISLVEKGGVPGEFHENVRAYSRANLTGGKEGSVSKLIDRLKTGEPDVIADTLEGLTTATEDWTKQQSDLPAYDEA